MVKYYYCTICRKSTRRSMMRDINLNKEYDVFGLVCIDCLARMINEY